MRTLRHSSTFLGLALTSILANACANPAPLAASSESVALDPASIEKGKTNYAMFCQACHGAQDAGIDSPSNLFDSKWYNGEGRSGIEHSIRNGISDKGMPAWGEMIPAEDINALVDYLISFQTTESASNE